jgi:monoamine oxidase
MPPDVDFLIVGCGAAGIGAARRLVSLGAIPLVLQAMDRVGGRALTRHVHGHRLDFGCGWLHSARRNTWTAIAEASGFTIDRRAPVWGEQFENLGFSADAQAAAGTSFDAWARRLAQNPPESDRASDALVPSGEWNAYIAAMTGYISGVPPEQLSISDYLTYDAAATEDNWRIAEGYGALITASLPAAADLRTGTAIHSIALTADGVAVETGAGTVRARTLILTVSTMALAGGRIRMPAELAPWQAAAAQVPLGRNEKLFLEIVGDAPFEDETYVLGNPRVSATGGYYIRPLGAPLIECFLGGDGARILDEGPEAGFAFAVNELANLFGSGVKRFLRPLAASNWQGEATIGGAYSSALPGHADARARLAQPFDDRVFFAGEATSPADFTTAHGAHDSGVRAADEAVKALARRR